MGGLVRSPTHPVNILCGRKPEYPEKTHDFRQSVDDSFYIENHVSAVGPTIPEVKSACACSCPPPPPSPTVLYLYSSSFLLQFIKLLEVVLLAGDLLGPLFVLVVLLLVVFVVPFVLCARGRCGSESLSTRSDGSR